MLNKKILILNFFNHIVVAGVSSNKAAPATEASVQLLFNKIDRIERNTLSKQDLENRIILSKDELQNIIYNAYKKGSQDARKREQTPFKKYSESIGTSANTLAVGAATVAGID